MPRSDLTDITLVLDRSGSMCAVHEATIEAFNTFLRFQRAAAGQARMTLVQFDDRYEPLYEAVSLEAAAELDAASFVPRGSTALLDAMGRTIVATGERLAAMPEAERPGTVLFVTLTDGHENSSLKYDIHQINRMIAEQRDKYRWQFVFLAANQDTIATAADMGIGASAAMSFEASPEGMEGTFEAVDEEIQRVRSCGAEGLSAAPVAFNSEQRRRAKR